MPTGDSKRFTILKALGRGGMGQVWLARDQELKKNVALKFLLPDPSQASLNFFKEEVRILSQLKHPHLVEIYDYFDRAAGCVEAPSNLSPSPNLLSPGFAMEYLSGKTLGEIDFPLAADRALRFFIQFCQGLAYLHGRGLTHRDLKPSNAILDEDGKIKLLDFGLAAERPLPRQGRGPGGTLSYLAPEAFWGEYHPVSDLFSLGVLFYQLLTGKLPYSKPLTRSPKTSPEALQGIRPELPEYFADLIHRLLELIPTKRPNSATALLRFIQQHGESDLFTIPTEEGVEAWEKLPLVGRREAWRWIQARLDKRTERERPTHLQIQGPTGIGRTRFLEEIRWHYQLDGMRWDRLRPEDSPEHFQNVLSLGKNQESPNGRYGILLEDLHFWNAGQWQEFNSFWEVSQRRRDPVVFLSDFNSEYGKIPELGKEADSLALDLLNDRDSKALLVSTSATDSIPKAMLEELIHQAGGRPLFLLEGLAQMRREGRARAPGKSWSFHVPAALDDIIEIHLKNLSQNGTDSLALLTTAPLPPTRSLFLDLCEHQFMEGAQGLEELIEKSIVAPPRPGANLQMKTPSLLKAFQKQLPRAATQGAHRRWLKFWTPRKKALWLAHHAKALGEKKIFKTWAIKGAEAWSSLGRDDRAKEYYDQYLAWAENPEERFTVHAHLAPFYFRRGQYDLALEAYDRWFAERPDDDSQTQKLKHFFYTGLVCFTAGDDSTAEKKFSRGLALGRPEKYSQHHPYLSRTHLLMGRLEERRGNFSQALDHYQRAHPLAERSPILLGEVEVNLGRLNRSMGKLETAKSHLNLAQSLYRKAGNPQAEAIAIHTLGLVERDQGFFRSALENMEQSIRLMEQAGAWLQRAAYLANQALLLQDLGKYSETWKTLQDSEAILETLGKKEQKLIFAIQKAHFLLLVGNFSRSDKILRSLEDRTQDLSQEKLKGALFWLQGESSRLKGNTQRALSFFKKILEEPEKTGTRLDRVTALIHMAFLEGGIKRHEQVLGEISEIEGPLFTLWRAYFQFLKTPTRERQEDKFLSLLKRIRDLESPELRREIYSNLSKTFFDQGLPALARRLEASAAFEWKKLYNSLSEELKMDYEKNRSLQSLEDNLSNLLPSSGPSSPPTQSSSSLPGGAGNISQMRFRQLTEINRQIGKKRNLEDILERVMDAAIELTGAERGFLVLKNPEAQIGPVQGFEVKTARHLNQSSLTEEDFQFSMTAIREAVDQGSYILTDNAQMDDRFQTQQSVMQFQLKAILVAPLEIEGTVLGAIYLDHRYQPGCFTEEDVVVLTAFASQAALAVEKAQILDELKRAKDQLEEKVESQARHIETLTGKLAQARDELRYEYGEIIGQSPAMMRVFQLLDHVTETTIPVWIWGESGTGKELVARSLHFNSPRKDGPFVSENCSAIPETLLESELFGHKKGAFTHADRDRQGLFEQASGGTLFLDEIGDMSMAMQAKLLRVLQEGEVRPVGSNKKVKVNVRLVTASHRDLNQMVSQGKFRQDLFYRVNGLTIILPPLRERPEDIPILGKHLIEKAAKEFNLKPSEITDEAYQVLYRYPWPGNIRELEATLRNALLFAKGRPITSEFLQLNPAIAGGQGLPRTQVSSAPRLPVTVSQPSAGTGTEDTEEKQMIMDALRRLQMNKAKAAEELGISLRTLYTRMEKLGIPKKKSLLAKYLGLA